MTKYIYILCLVCAVFTSQAQKLSVTLTKIETECIYAEALITIDTVTFKPVHYLWSTGAIGDHVRELENGRYSVKITDDHNNDTTIYFRISTPECGPAPENNFTPNYDGFNDTWSISRINNFPDFELHVYNRWGQQVHYQSGTYIPWDGRSLGIPLPDATYYYILYYSKTDKSKLAKGDISIIR